MPSTKKPARPKGIYSPAMRLLRRFLRLAGYALFAFAIIVVMLNFIPANGHKTHAIATEETIEVWVVSSGFHSGFILPTHLGDSLITDFLPASEKYPFVEVGWGERDFYTTPKFSYLLGAKALFWANDAVLHINFWQQHQVASQKGRKLCLAKEDYLRLVTILKNTCQSSQPIAKGLYGQAPYFLPATGTYWALENCNTWTARCLRQIHVKAPLWAHTAYTVRRLLPVACATQ